MKKLKISDGFKIVPSQEGKSYLINDRFPLHWLVYYLSLHRCYNKELTDNHIKVYYNLDVSELLENKDVSYWVWSKTDIYKEYLSDYPRKDFKENNREHFNHKGRNYFLKFTHNSDIDFVNGNMKMSVVHHIHPLGCGGTNKLENIIGISDYNREILHNNPKENIEKYCHQAVDYLWYLYSPWDSDKNNRILDKYGVTTIAKNNMDNPNFIIDVYLSAIKSEMNEFYKYIENMRE